jgi:hypothetical protein
MTRGILIISDVLLVVALILINFANGGFSKNPVIINAMVVIAFVSSIIRHINYYKLTKRIY